ncbi:phosphoribosylglycinamide formyltransferase 2 domain protein [Mycobacterium xenopi 4042]|uniref:Phosphoribosylglycinamide formyltransferase 2 domain protein n=1 Tax=Mycobacterium xenopi 4042 TaxID=1299334 RepID=X8DJ39_MYCXE|nr:phosphoribosylglycinamide formyltransferase 2 domain protein [Mycobacterium xenopi 4042]
MMLLGAGELSRELVIVFQRFGAEVIAVEHYADAPAHRVADQSLVVKITDADELSAVIGRVQPNFVVALTDAVAADALAAAGETGFTEVVPAPAACACPPTARDCGDWPPTNWGCRPRRSGSPVRSTNSKPCPRMPAIRCWSNRCVRSAVRPLGSVRAR